MVKLLCLAIKGNLDSLWYFELGRRFILVSYHAPLTCMRQNKEANAREAHRLLSLHEYSFVVQHQNVDALSQVQYRMSGMGP